MWPLDQITMNQFENYKDYKIYRQIHELQKKLSSGGYKNIYDKDIYPILVEINNDEDSILIIKHLKKLNWRNRVTNDLFRILFATDLVWMPEDEEDQRDEDGYVEGYTGPGYFDIDVEEIPLNRQ